MIEHLRQELDHFKSKSDPLAFENVKLTLDEMEKDLLDATRIDSPIFDHLRIIWTLGAREVFLYFSDRIVLGTAYNDKVLCKTWDVSDLTNVLISKQARYHELKCEQLTLVETLEYIRHFIWDSSEEVGIIK